VRPPEKGRTKLIGQKTGSDVMYFNGIGFNLNGTQYYYVKNLQKDITAVLDSNGNVVAQYEYDAWGSVISATGSLAEINTIRYRSYYYDVETEMYYNQQRYYVPQWSRWLSADGLAIMHKINGSNIFAYCLNNPIKWADYNGMYPQLQLNPPPGPPIWQALFIIGQIIDWLSFYDYENLANGLIDFVLQRMATLTGGVC